MTLQRQPMELGCWRCCDLARPAAGGYRGRAGWCQEPARRCRGGPRSRVAASPTNAFVARMMARTTLHIGQRLGAGRLAEVREVTVDGRRVVVKSLSTRTPADRDAITRLHREAEMTAELAHPNIRALLGRGDRCLLLEHLDLCLADVLRAGGALPVDAAIYIVCELFRALDYVHGRGRIHRDVTTANILVTMDGAIKLADFETSKVLGTPQTTGVLLRGTPGYLSPEQLNGAELDERSDVFSAGVVLYELLTGELPFGRTRETMLAGLYGPDPPAPVYRHRPELAQHEQLLEALEQVLERSHAARCPSAACALDAMPRSRQGRAEFVTRLAELYAAGAFDKPAADTATPGPPGDIVSRWSSVRGALRLTAGLVVLLLAVVIGWSQAGLLAGTHEPAPAASYRALIEQRIEAHYQRRTPQRPGQTVPAAPDPLDRFYQFSNLPAAAPGVARGEEE